MFAALDDPKRAEQKNRKRADVVPFFLVVFSCCVVFLCWYFLAQQKTQKRYEELAQIAKTPAASLQSADAGTPQEQPVAVQLDFAALKAENSDICAWITIPGTNVDYPVLQNEQDSNYYIDHTVDKASGTAGALYISNWVSPDFSEGNTIVYGHNMKNKTMFGSLHSYEKADFFADEANRTITVYTPERTYTYRIYAAVLYGNNLLSDDFDFSSPSERQAFLDLLKTNGKAVDQIDDTMQPTGADRLITLSTCASDHAYRYLVVGVLTDAA